MAKRFCDTEIWQKDWFLNLSDKQKLLTKFLFDNCDCAGIYEISWRIIKIFFNSEITKNDFEKIKQVKFIDDNTIFIEDFIFFQCGINSLNELNPNNNAHKGIIKRLKKYDLFLAPSEPLTSPSLGAHSVAQENENEKEKEIIISFNKEEKEINKEKEEKIDPQTLFIKVRETYKRITGKDGFLTFEQITKGLYPTFVENKDFISTFEHVCFVLKALQDVWSERINFTPGLSWLFQADKDKGKSNYATIRDGCYEQLYREWRKQNAIKQSKLNKEYITDE